MTKGELRDELPHSQWDDPEGLASLSAGNRELILSNPLGSRADDDDEPVQLVGLLGDRVIGRLNLLYGQLEFHGETVPILWGSGFYVPEEYRSTGIGLMLILKSQCLPFVVGAIGPSQLARPLYKKLGWVDLAAPRYVLACRARPLVESVVGAGPIARVVAAPIDVGLWLHRRVLASVLHRSQRGLRVEQAPTMPAELDPQLRANPAIASCPRSSDWLNWILEPGRSPNHRTLYLVRTADGSVVGYFIVTHRLHETAGGGRFKNLNLGSVKDWRSFDRGVVSDETLILLAVRELLRLPLDAVDVCATESSIGRRLRTLGFLRQGAMHFMFRPPPGTILSDPESHAVENWWLRPADGDYLFF